MLKEILKEINENVCGTTYALAYIPKIFDIMKKNQIAGSYPRGGKVVVKVDQKLLDLIKKNYKSVDNIKVGDCVSMDNGWSLD